MRIDDLIISISYFSIPIQLVISLYRYPRLTKMPNKIVALLILFALFVFFCGVGHALKCLDKTDTVLFAVTNSLTAATSLVTAVYLIPLVPNLMNTIDEGLENIRMNEQILESRQKLLTFMSFLCHEIRYVCL